MTRTLRLDDSVVTTTIETEADRDTDLVALARVLIRAIDGSNASEPLEVEPEQSIRFG